MNASERLTQALADLANADQRTPCQRTHADRWTSDDVDEREWAAHACRMCPVLRVCGEAATEYRAKHHVWAGVDRTPKPRTTNRKAI